MQFAKRFAVFFLIFFIAAGPFNFKTAGTAYAAAPTATIIVADTSLAIGETSLVTITFSEAVQGFTTADLTVENGTLSAVSTSDGGRTWTATLTPAANVTSSTNIITLYNGGVMDLAGNAGTGTTLSNNYVIATVQLTAAITLTDTALKIGDVSLVTITFSEAVSGFSTANFTVGNGNLDNLSSSDGGRTWTAVLTPNAEVEDTANVIVLDNTKVLNAFGNAGTGTTESGSYAIDTRRPTATIIVADTNLAIGDASLVTTTFSKPVVGVDKGDFTVQNGTMSFPNSADGGRTWTATLTPTANVTSLTNIITFDQAGVMDLAGNIGTGTTLSNNYAVDTVRPTGTVTVANAQLKAGETSLVTIVFSEAVTGFTNADLTVDNATLNPISSSDGGRTWTAALTPTANLASSTNIVTLDQAGVTDLAGNSGIGHSHSNHYAIQTVRPTATLLVESTSLTAGKTSRVTITFSEAVTDFSNSDLNVANGTLSTVVSSDGGITWTATLTPQAHTNANGNVITLQNDGVRSSVGNAGEGTTESNPYAVLTVLPVSDGGPSVPPAPPVSMEPPTLPTDGLIIDTTGNLTLPVGRSGTVSLERQIYISIPAGAALQELKISMRTVPNAQALLTDQQVLASSVFEVLKNFPENFVKPVKLSLVFDPALFDDVQQPAVFYYDEAKKSWVKVEGGVIEGNQITVEVDHFTKYAVLAFKDREEMPVNEESAQPAFHDTAGHWAESDIQRAVSEGIAAGYPNGTFRPQSSVTRAEFAVMLTRALNARETSAQLAFTDAPDIGNWARQAVAQALQAGIVKGYADGSFRPNAQVTRAEMAQMIANALKLSVRESTATPFSDDQRIPIWAKSAVAALAAIDIVKGTDMNQFNPSAPMTRAEAVTVLLSMLERSK